MSIKYFLINWIIILFILFPIYSQTPQIKWWFDTKDASFGQSAAGDIDNDGKLEIVFGCYRNDSCVYALNAEDGSLLWKYNTHPFGAEGCNDVAPIIYDIDNDDTLEVIVPSSCNPKTFCFNGKTGAVKWQVSTRGSDSPPSIADEDNDRKPEILHGEFGGYVICINGENGTQSWEIPIDLDAWIQTAPTIVDLNNDEQLDFVVGTWNSTIPANNKVYAYHGNNQNILWSYTIGDVMYHGTAVADLDYDGKPELVIGSYNDTLYCINGDNGTTAWKYKFPNGYYIGAPSTIADIDNDNECEVIFVDWHYVIALSNAGVYKWHYNIPNYEQAFRGVVASDVNNDDYLDIIFGTSGGEVIALNGNDGTLIWKINLALHYGNSNFGFDHAPLVADFDNDGILDIFIVGGYATYPDFQNNFGRAYMFSVGVGRGPDWLMFQHDVLRRSSLCDISNPVADYKFEDEQFFIYPNPTNGIINLKINNPNAKDVTIEITDIMGKTINKFTKDCDNALCEETIDLSNLDNGIYFVKLSNNTKYSIIKFIKQ
jgi:outer membrane protein assembly factor BamB